MQKTLAFQSINTHVFQQAASSQATLFVIAFSSILCVERYFMKLLYTPITLEVRSFSSSVLLHLYLYIYTTLIFVCIYIYILYIQKDHQAKLQWESEDSVMQEVSKWDM